MSQARAKDRKKGAPRKASDGLDKVLFVRTNQELLDELEKLRQSRAAQNPGITISTAGVARAALWEVIAREKGTK